MRIIIAGGRDVTDYAVLLDALKRSGYWKAYKHNIEVVCGMARGADLLGKKFAERNGLVVHEFPADWDKNGKAAGHIRNAEMGKFAKEHDGRLLALWNGTSVGTKNMIEWASKNNLEGYVYRTDKPCRYASVGDKVFTNFSGKVTSHNITGVVNSPFQSGVLLTLEPAVPMSEGTTALFDADWFQYDKESLT